jgi:hypothetical protein
MNTRNIYLLSAFLLGVLLVSACIKPKFDKIASTAWNPNLAVPLAYGTFDVYDIFANDNPDDLVVIDPTTGAIALVYRSDLTVVDGEQLVGLQQISEGFTVSSGSMNLVPSGAFNGTQNGSSSQTFAVNGASGVELHNMLAKNGQLTINLSTNLAHTVNVVLTFPGIVVGGNPLQQTIQMKYQGSVPHTATANINLSNALMDLTVGNTTVNSLQVNVQTTVTGSGQAINGSENLEVNLSTNNLAFSNAYGYFGQQSIVNFSDSILIKIFENSEAQGYFEFTNPSLKVLAENSMGLPIRLIFNNLRTVIVSSGQEFMMTGYPAVHNINFPPFIGGMMESLIVFNSSNTTNISTVITPVPKYLAFGLSAFTNPDGPSAILNFVSDTSKVRLRSELELPLEGFAYGFGVKDTVPFSLSQDVAMIEYVMFRLIMDNGFPVQLGAQLRFMDENYNVLFTAWDQITEVVAPASVNSQGVVNQRGYKITDIVLEDWKLELLPQVAHIEIEGNTQTTNGPLGVVVKFFDWYNLNMKLSMQIQAKMNF